VNTAKDAEPGALKEICSRRRLGVELGEPIYGIYRSVGSHWRRNIGRDSSKSVLDSMSVI